MTDLLIKRLLSLALVGAFMLSVNPVPILAQSSPLPRSTAEELLEDVLTRLNERSKDAADEYLDILIKLQDVLEDYSDYLLDLDDKDRLRHTLSFKTFTTALKNDTYISDLERLPDDIENFSSEIETIEQRHRLSEKSNQPACCNLLRNFRRELGVISELADDYISSNKRRHMAAKEIRAYLLAELDKIRTKGAREVLLSEELVERLLEQGEIDEAIREKLEQKLEEDIYSKGRTEEDLYSDAKKNKNKHKPVKPARPPTPVRPTTKLPPIEFRTGKSGHKVYGRSNEYAESLAVASSKVPITIELPFGNLEIVGWEQKMILATMEVEVSSQSSIKEKEFLAQSMLKLAKSTSGYSVEASMPQHGSGDTKLLNASLTIYLPAQNHLICDHQFGEVKISGVMNGVELNCKSSSITLSEITGGAIVDNSAGEVSVSDVSGALKIANTFKPISVSDCNGEMNLENAYSEISLSDSKGNAAIRNTGAIQISSHAGNIQLNNSYGAVILEDVKGNLIINNAFGKVAISNVIGSAFLANSYANITAEDVHGLLNANTQFGIISASLLSGPINLVNQNGVIQVVLDGALRGTSTIHSSFGSIDISASDRCNIILSASAREGKIQFLKPIQIIDRGAVKTAIIKFGTGKDSLFVTGVNCPIIISE